VNGLFHSVSLSLHLILSHSKNTEAYSRGSRPHQFTDCFLDDKPFHQVWWCPIQILLSLLRPPVTAVGPNMWPGIRRGRLPEGGCCWAAVRTGDGGGGVGVSCSGTRCWPIGGDGDWKESGRRRVLYEEAAVPPPSSWRWLDRGRTGVPDERMRRPPPGSPLLAASSSSSP
jgi:hypothetical protein